MYFQQWQEYFLSNQTHFDHICLQKEDLFCIAEQKRFASSLQQFQRGEHSEGKHLLSFAKQYGDPYYTAAIQLFIKEEQDHAMILGKFLDKYSIPRIKDHWVDGVFRMLRKLAGIENTISILLVAEIISKVYYRALMNATSSELLKDICLQILRDEEKHLHFQCYTLNRLKNKHTRAGNFLRYLYLKVVLTGTIAVVWNYHQAVLRSGGFTFATFYKANQTIFQSLLQMIKGQKEIPPALVHIQDELLIA
jgi:uncharacterized membrane protein